MAERSKALDLGSSLSGGVGSNPTAATNVFNYFKLRNYHGLKHSFKCPDISKSKELHHFVIILICLRKI